MKKQKKKKVREPSILYFFLKIIEAGGSLILKIFKELELKVL
jgi:hypothetical protein